MDEITITVAARTGKGKSFVMALIEEKLKEHFGDAMIINSPDLDEELKLTRREDLHPPAERTVLILRELNLRRRTDY